MYVVVYVIVANTKLFLLKTIYYKLIEEKNYTRYIEEDFGDE